MLSLILTNFAIMLSLFIALWVLSIALKNASIVDIAWGPACALPAILTWFLADGSDPRALILTVLVGLWGLRLGAYLAIRNIGHGEDFRYVRMREKAGGDSKFIMKSLYSVFLLQCVVSFFVSLPTQIGQFGSSAIAGSPTGALGPVAYFGLAIFFVGIAFETIGDFQLRQFKKDPANKGKLMDRGLWSWTRHPNYFGDAAVWVGLTLIALEGRYGVYTILSPALMIYFLYALSGKALLERSMARRYPEFESYKQRVSGFFPKPPRSP